MSQRLNPNHAPRRYSLAHLTALSLSPPELIDVASKAGYQDVSLRLLPAAPGGMAYRLMDDSAMFKATLTAIEATGVKVFDLEIVRLGPEFDAKDYVRFFEAGARLGAQAVLVGGDDEDRSRRADSFASLCEAAAPFGLSAQIEFMPWTAVASLRDAKQLIDGAGRPRNCGILVDALHFARSDSLLAEVLALPPDLLRYAQICDAPAEVPDTHAGLIHTARCERLLPGEGGIDLGALWNALPAGLAVGVEIPNDARAAEVGPLAWAKAGLAAAQQLVENAVPQRDARSAAIG